jgi:DNA cross-link repair 1A protein
MIETTANLITRVLGVERKWVVPLAYDVPTILPNTGGVICTMIEANHCPGSALFLFEGKRTCNAGDSPYQVSGVGSARIYRYLHCGDFRCAVTFLPSPLGLARPPMLTSDRHAYLDDSACPKIVLHPEIARAPLDEVYLDTTYLNPHYCFPPQPVVIDSVSKLAKSLVLGTGTDTGSAAGSSTAAPPSGLAGWVTRDESETAQKEREEKARLRGSRTLVAVGTYSIGKERIVKGQLASISRLWRRVDR